MRKLTALQVRQVKEKCRLADGGGLFFEITASGVKRWLYRYKIKGKGNMFIIGRYPEMSLEAARKSHLLKRELVRQGVNPADERRERRQAIIDKKEEEKAARLNSFENVALEWIEQQRDGWSTKHAKDVLSTLQRDVFPQIGGFPVDSIIPPQVLTVLRAVESRGVGETARRTLQRMDAVFRYAVQTGRATYNPASDMKGVLKVRPPVENRPASHGAELGQLLRDISANKKAHVQTKLALHFLALTATRPSETRSATWEEFDLERQEWNIPAERMKINKPHLVPLSEQALAVLHRAAALFGDTGLVFPSVRDKDKPMSDNALSKCLRDMGYRGKATPHGFRSSFSTAAYERSGCDGEIIEMCLAHVEQNAVKAAYNRARYLGQRRQLLQWWGNMLQRLEHGAEVIRLEQRVV